MNTLYFTYLFAAAAFAADPNEETKRDKVLEKILDGKYSSSTLKDLGSTTSICKHLEEDHVEAIQAKMKKAHMKLNSKCVLAILKENATAFEKLTEDIDDDKDKKKFFRIHAEAFCDNKKPFKDHNEREWYKPLDSFCAKYEAEDAKEKLEEERKLRKELEEQLEKKATAPGSGAQALGATTLQGILLALVIFTAVFV